MSLVSLVILILVPTIYSYIPGYFPDKMGPGREYFPYFGVDNFASNTLVYKFNATHRIKYCKSRFYLEKFEKLPEVYFPYPDYNVTCVEGGKSETHNVYMYTVDRCDEEGCCYRREKVPVNFGCRC